MTNPMDLKGKRILVTGASSGIGKATAQLLSRLGSEVVIMGRDEERLRATFESLSGSRHSHYCYELSDLDRIPSVIKKIAEERGSFSGLFHSAGIITIMPLSILKKKTMDSFFDINLKAALILARAFSLKGVLLPNLGSLVFMSSAASIRGVAGMSLYSASKAAIDGAVRSMACELAHRGIRVNAIIAGAVQTEMHKTITKNLTPDQVSNYQNRHLLGFGQPEDIAQAAAFLLSDASRWITGTTMIVDGGYCCV